MCIAGAMRNSRVGTGLRENACIEFDFTFSLTFFFSSADSREFLRMVWSSVAVFLFTILIKEVAQEQMSTRRFVGSVVSVSPDNCSF